MEDIERITHVATMTDNIGTKYMEIMDDYLFVGVSYESISIFYIHDPSSPQFTVTMPSGSYYNLNACIYTDLLYILESGNEIAIYNLATFMTHGEIIKLGGDVNEGILLYECISCCRVQ